MSMKATEMRFQLLLFSEIILYLQCHPLIASVSLSVVSE